MFDLRPYNRKNNVTSYNPFREMDSFFDDPFRFFDGKALAEFNTDIIESGNNYILEADLPGFEKGDIKLDVKDDILTIKAERHTETEKRTRTAGVSAASVPTAHIQDSLTFPVLIPIRFRLNTKTVS